MSTSASAMSTFTTMISLLALVANFLPLTAAHSWIEEYSVVQPNGSYIGARGYSRGFVPRDDPSYNGDSMRWMLPSLSARNPDGTVRSRIDSSDFICHTNQRTSTYASAYPKLKVQPGDYVAMKYLENGHTSLPWNITGKPVGGGTVFVFGTTKPKNDEKITDVMKWTSDGKGGDGRGFLMTAQNFDDGRCTQINCGSISGQRQMLTPNHMAGQPQSTFETWCETDLKIPANVQPGTLTTYWVWQWPTEPNRDCNTPAGKDEYYTTCADFDVLANNVANKAIIRTPFNASDSQPQSAAVSDFKSRTAFTTAPTFVAMSNNKIVGSIESVKPAFVSSCQAQASVISAHNLGVWPQVYVPNTCSPVTSFGAAAASSAAASFSKAASAYSASSSAAFAAAFKAAGMAVPSQQPWSMAPSTGGAQMTATAAPPAASAPPTYGNFSSPAAPSSSAAAVAPSYTARASAPPPAADGAVTSIYTVTTVLTLTSTLPAGQAAPSAPAPPAESSAPAAASSAPAAYGSLSTVTTVSNTPSIPSVGANGSVYRRHPRHLVH